MPNRNLNLILLGPPGSGKGTQGERLQEDLELPYYATGDILRAAVRDETEIGKAAKEYMDRGDLVPDDVIIGVIAERLESGEADHGFILDGFPRTVPQAEALDQKLGELGRQLTAVVLIDVSDEEIVHRLSGRRVCTEGGHVYHVDFNPPKPGRRLRHRRLRADRARRRQARSGPSPSGPVPREDRSAGRLLQQAGPAQPGRRQPGPGSGR